MALLGIGIGSALVPLTTAGIAGVRPDDAGAASGLVNVAQQLGGSLGLGILVTVFAAASHVALPHPTGGSSLHSAAQQQLAYAIGRALTGSAVFLALGLVVVVGVMRTPRSAPVPATSESDELAEVLESAFD
jgi:hypothetical protein